MNDRSDYEAMILEDLCGDLPEDVLTQAAYEQYHEDFERDDDDDFEEDDREPSDYDEFLEAQL